MDEQDVQTINVSVSSEYINACTPHAVSLFFHRHVTHLPHESFFNRVTALSVASARLCSAARKRPYRIFSALNLLFFSALRFKYETYSACRFI